MVRAEVCAIAALRLSCNGDVLDVVPVEFSEDEWIRCSRPSPEPSPVKKAELQSAIVRT